MDKKDPKYESLKSKLLKLSRLADSGDTHEARNARFAIERLCSQYGISIEEITAEVQEKKWYGFEVGRSASVVLRPPKTPVLQFDVNGKFIAEYESATLAAKTVGTSQSGITKCCQGHYKTCMGYVFKYKNKVSQKL